MLIRFTWRRIVMMCALCELARPGVGAPIAAQGAGQRRPPGAPDPAKLPKSPKIPVTFDALFAERNARALGAVAYLNCMQGTVTALRSGALGNVPRDWSITCIAQDGEWRGVFGALTDASISVRLQYAVRATGSALTTRRVDTARVNGTARALLRGLSVPLPGAGAYEFVPVPLTQGKFIELWFLPAPSDPTRLVIGGDSLIQMSADGVRELGHGRSTPRIRVVEPPPTGAKTLALESSEDRIPTVSELMLAHNARVGVADVRIRTRQYESVLTRATGRWTHRRQR